MTGEKARRRAPWVAAVLALVLLPALAGAWMLAVDHQQDRTTVSWVGPVECTGTRVAGTSSSGARFTAAELRPSMRCHRAVRVRNRGPLPVEIERLVLPIMGPNGGAKVQVTSLEGRPPSARDEHGPDPVDAVFATGWRLPAGADRAFDLEFTYRPDGCTSEGLLGAGQPKIELRTWGRRSVKVPRGQVQFRALPSGRPC